MRGLVLSVLFLAWSYLVINVVLHAPVAKELLQVPNSGLVSSETSKALANHCDEVDVNDRCISYKVSLLELISRPELFDGRRVRVTGYVHLEFEGNALYLSRHDLDHHQYANGVWVEFASGIANKECQNNDVIIEGTFSAEDRGHMGMWSGAIREIELCQPW